MTSTPPSSSPPTPEPPSSEWQLVHISPDSRRLVLHRPWKGDFAVSSYPALLPSTSSHSLTTTTKRTRESQRASPDQFPPPLPDSSNPSSTSTTPLATAECCPLCYQSLPRTPQHRPSFTRASLRPLPPSSESADQSDNDDDGRPWPSRTRRLWNGRRKEGAYFELLSEVNSVVNSPRTTGAGAGAAATAASRGIEGSPTVDVDPHLTEGQMNEGYCAKFFREEALLGKGGQGAVYLVRHVLNGEELGRYALKKIRVGDSTLSLLSLLREVHLLESVSHPNIISYHHAWLETSLPRPFSPAVPTLHVLMSWANGGSLEEFVRQRSGRGGGEGGPGEGEGSDKERAKERVRARRRGGGGKAVHLLRVEDLLHLFRDVVVGLAFLHSKNILHLDLKADNVLLQWDDDALLPTCKLSDFGNATNDSYHRERHGGSGTLSYTPPESFSPDPRNGHLPSPDRATDQWALGLLLHLLCFFALPWKEEDDMEVLEKEIREYRGFFPSSLSTSPSLAARHDLPPSLHHLLSSLIHLRPTSRPSCERVERALPGILDDARELAEQAERTDEGEEVVVFRPLNRGLGSQGAEGEGREEDRFEDESEMVEGGGGVGEPHEERKWLLLPPPTPISRRASSPSLLFPSTDRPRVSPPLPLPAPPTSSSSRARRSPSPRFKVHLRDALGPRRVDGRVGRKAVAVVVGIAKILLASPSPAAQLPTSLALAILLETALDVALADLRVTAGLAVVHAAVCAAMGAVTAWSG